MTPARPNSLRAGIEAEHGEGIRRIGIVKRVGTVVFPRTLTRLLRSYIDETKKSSATVAAVGPEAPDYADRVVQGLAPQRPGVDFVEGSHGLRVFGFLSDVVGGAGVVETLTDEQIISHLNSWWFARRGQGKGKKLAYHLVFSLDPRIGARMGERGISVDDVLTSCSCDSLATYNARYYPSGTLGWISGIHHDRHHIHAHVLLFPETSDGVALNLSDRAPCDCGVGQPVRVNFRETMARAYLQSLEQTIRMFEAPSLHCLRESDEAVAQIAGLLFLVADRRTAAGLPIDMDGVASTLSSTLDEPVILSLINGKIDEIRRDDARDGGRFDLSFGSLEKLSKFAQGMTTPLRAEEEAMAALRDRIAKERKLIEDLLSIPGRYALQYYTPSSQAMSPSGTFSYLLSGKTDRPPKWEPGWQEIQEIVRSRLMTYDAAMDIRMKSWMPGPVLDEKFVNAQEVRAAHAYFFAHAGATTWNRLRHRPHHFVQFPSLDHLTVQSIGQARRNRDALIAKASLEMATANRTATVDELVTAHQRRIVMQRAGVEDDSAEPTVLSLPQGQSVLPATPNFLERESAPRIRTLDEIRQADHDLLERLTQALAVEPTPRYMTMA